MLKAACIEIIEEFTTELVMLKVPVADLKRVLGYGSDDLVRLILALLIARSV